MIFNRKMLKISAAGTSWKIKQLVPADFLNCDGWPFSVFRIEGFETEQDRLKKMFPSKSGLRDKRLITAEEREKELIYQLFFKALSPYVPREGLGGKYEYGKILADNELHKLLLTKIFELAYDGAFEDSTPRNIIIKKIFADQILYASQKANCEPWEFYGQKNDLPALYNPIRWDFNLSIWQISIHNENEIAKKIASMNKGR